MSDNPMIAPAMDAHWTYTQRVMGEVLMRDEKPRDIWDQHEGLMKAIASGKTAKAEELAHQHIQKAADFMVTRLHASLPKDRAVTRDR